LSNILAREVFHEGVQSRKTLARRPSDPFEKNIDRNISNPCDSPMLRKVFRPKVNRAYFYHQQVKQLSCFLFRYPETRKGPMEGPLDGGDTYPLGYRILL
jgi:hypothetical protein